MTISDLIEDIYLTRRMVYSHENIRYEKNFKPILLLALLDHFELTNATKISWSSTLRKRHQAYESLILNPWEKHNICDPFGRLDCMNWRISNVDGTPHEQLPKIGEFGQIYGQFGDQETQLLQDPTIRHHLRKAIIARFFLHKRDIILNLALQTSSNTIEPTKDNDEESSYRNQAFSKLIRDLYDNQCVACGQRIVIPNLQTSFVDAAHLMPYAKTQDDRPTNGISLCKNHHWAMDRRIIAPTPELTWAVSPLLHGARSPAESELLKLADCPLLPAKDNLTPDKEALEWRHNNLLT